MTRRLARALVASAAIGGSVSAADEPLALPHTIANVWYRTDTVHGMFGPKHEGDLRITQDALEFSARKAELVIPLTALTIISLGPMGSDLDTDWVVIGIEREGAISLLGLRDGSRMGYGGRTPDIFRTLLRVARERHVAQFAAPDGFEPYTRFDGQIALAIPQGWTALQNGIAGLDERGVTGTILFSPDARPEGASAGISDAERAEVVRRVRVGESPAMILVIRKAKRGMGASGFTEKGRAELLRSIAANELLGLDLAGPAAGALAPAALDRCAGLAGVWKGALDAGTEVVLDLRVASDDDFVYYLALRARADRATTLGPTFERALGTVHFAVARPPGPNGL